MKKSVHGLAKNASTEVQFPVDLDKLFSLYKCPSYIEKNNLKLCKLFLSSLVQLI